MSRPLITVIAVVLLLHLAGCAAGPQTHASLETPGARSEPPLSPHSPMADPATVAWVSAGQPGPYHHHLDVLVGEFDTTFEVRGGPEGDWQHSAGIVKRQWILGGRYLQEEVDAQGDTGHFKGIGFVAYSNIDGQYELFWMDVQSTGFLRETATFDEARKVFASRSTMRDPFTGTLIIGRGELNVSNPDRHVYTGFAIDERGREYECFRGVMERRQ